MNTCQDTGRLFILRTTSVTKLLLIQPDDIISIQHYSQNLIGGVKNEMGLQCLRLCT